MPMSDEARAELHEYYSNLLGEDVWEASWKLICRAGYSESSIPYMAPELIHQCCGKELMKTWREKVWPNYPYV